MAAAAAAAKSDEEMSLVVAERDDLSQRLQSVERRVEVCDSLVIPGSHTQLPTETLYGVSHGPTAIDTYGSIALLYYTQVSALS